MERCPAEGKGWETYQGFSSANITLQPLYHLNKFLWDSVQALYNPVLPECRRVAEAACSYPWEMFVVNALQRAHIVQAWLGPWQCSWKAEVQPCPGVALPVSGSVMSSLPAEKMQLLHAGGGKTVTFYLVVMRVTCQMVLGFSFLFLYPVQGLFKEHKVQSPRWALLPIHADSYSLSCSLSLAL